MIELDFGGTVFDCKNLGDLRKFINMCDNIPDETPVGIYEEVEEEGVEKFFDISKIHIEKCEDGYEISFT